MIENRLIRIRDVQRKVSLGRSTIWLFIKQKRFPTGFKIGNKVRVWFESDIDSYIEEMRNQNQKNEVNGG